MNALAGLTEHQVRALKHLARLKGPGLVRSREVGEPAAKALVARGLATRSMHEHTRSKPRGTGFKLTLYRIEQIALTDAGRAAALGLP